MVHATAEDEGTVVAPITRDELTAVERAFPGPAQATLSKSALQPRLLTVQNVPDTEEYHHGTRDDPLIMGEDTSDTEPVPV